MIENKPMKIRNNSPIFETVKIFDGLNKEITPSWQELLT